MLVRVVQYTEYEKTNWIAGVETHVIGGGYLSDRMDFGVDEHGPDAGRGLPLEADVVPVSSGQRCVFRGHQPILDRHPHRFLRLHVNPPQQNRFFFATWTKIENYNRKTPPLPPSPPSLVRLNISNIVVFFDCILLKNKYGRVVSNERRTITMVLIVRNKGIDNII